jgi:hypothetical protein
MTLRIVKTVGFSILALAIGFFSMTLFFSDLGPGETLFSRFVIAVILYLVVGLIIGFFNTKVWMLAGLVSWGTVMLGLIGLVRGEDVSSSFFMVFLSLGPSLLGGFLGSYASKKLIRRKYS